MNAIVVVDQMWAIGREGKLLFNLPADMERFKSLTIGGTIIMGRRSLNSFSTPCQLRQEGSRQVQTA